MDRTPWIVVGTDFSEGAACALELGVHVAAKVGASVACVHAYEDAPGIRLSDDPTRELDEQLAEVASSCGAQHKGVRVETLVRRGPPWEKLLNVAFDVGALLIVVGARGLGHRPQTPFLGTVAMRVAALSTRMVLIVPSRAVVPAGFDTRDRTADLARLGS